MKRPGLPWIPVGTGLLYAVGLAYAWLSPELERNLANFLVLILTGLVGAINLLWFLCSRRFPGRVRLGVAVLVAGAVFVLPRLVKVDGTRDGTGLPRLVWRWQAPAAAPAPPPQAAGVSTNLIDPIASSTTTTPAGVEALPDGLADTPQFLGPRRTGVLDYHGFATDWSVDAPRQLWRQPVGAGWSAFAVVGERAYTQEQRGEEEWVTCYALRTGKLLWAHVDAERFFQWQGGEGPRATPTVHEGRVFTYGGTGVLNCLEAASGRVVWKRSVLKERELANIEWGVSASPLVAGSRVIVTGGNTEGPVLFAYARDTGEPLWAAGNDRANYSSPIIATLLGREVVLSSNAGGLSVHKLEDGAVLLDYRWGNPKWPKASQPVVLPGDRVFLSAGYGMGCVLLQLRAAVEDKFEAELVWKGMAMKTQFNSAAYQDGFLYGLDDGRLACVDAATGERLWKDGRFGSGQTLLAGALILVQSEPGAVYLARAERDGYRELSRLPALSSKTWNYPTLAGRHLLVRNDREAVCYELAAANSRSSSGSASR